MKPLSIRPNKVATAARVNASSCPRVMARIRVTNIATVMNSTLIIVLPLCRLIGFSGKHKDALEHV